MRRSAAFFDLDRTIIATSSSLAFARPLYEHGLIGRRDYLQATLAQLVFLRSGAGHNQVEAIREYLSRLVTGWDAAEVRRIVSDHLPEIIEPALYREALDVIAEHRDAGRDVIIISSAGVDVVEPIGELLGVDHAVGTRVDVLDGRYTGEILFYAFAEGKADAVRTMALEHGYELEDCWAYSDSITDLPLLESVGHPVCTNPDAGLRSQAAARGWPVLEFTRPANLPTTSQRLGELSAAIPGRRWTVAVTGATTAVAGLLWVAVRQRGRVKDT